MRMVWKLNPPEGIGKRLVTCCRKAIDALLGNTSDTEDALSAAMCIADQTLHACCTFVKDTDVKLCTALAQPWGCNFLVRNISGFNICKQKLFSTKTIDKLITNK